MARGNRIVTCARCKNDRRHLARGLCANCYKHERDSGRLDSWPTRLPVADVIEEVELLRSASVPPSEIAERLGTTSYALGQRLVLNGRPDLGQDILRVGNREYQRARRSHVGGGE